MANDSADTLPITDSDIYYAILLARIKDSYTQEANNADTCD
jgi:hypothetical protein